MHPEITHMISAERNRDMRDQAAAWRGAGEVPSAARTRPVRIHFAAIACLARTAQFVPGLKAPQRPAAT
jgi:hypothetical protein